MNVIGQTNFGPLDWAIVTAYLSVSVAVGLYVRRLIADMTDYVVAGRAMGTALGVASMTGTELGLITIMYSAQKGFVGGFAAFHMAVVAAIVTFLVGLSGFIVVKLRAARILTIPEYYERRFGRRTRILGAVMLAVGGILNMGMFLKVESMFIVAVTGMEPGTALTGVMVVLLTLSLLYTVFGGMIADLVTDYIQFVVLALGLLLACALAVKTVGWEPLFTTVNAHMGEKGFNPLVEGEFGPEYVAWMAFLGLVSCALWPTAVARALAAKSAAVVRKVYLWSSIGFMTRFLIPYFLGICALVYVLGTPELKQAFFPPAGGQPLDNLYALPVFLARILPTGLLGLIVAAMLAALMSTYDSYLLCWSSVITQDIVAPLTGQRMSARARILLTRFLIAAIGVYLVYWGLFYTGDEDIWDYMTVSGAIYFTGAFAVLVGGLYWKRASSTGAVMALFCGFSALLGLSPIQRALGFTMAPARVGLLTVALTVVTMVAGSLLFPDREIPSRGSRAGGR